MTHALLSLIILSTLFAQDVFANKPMQLQQGDELVTVILRTGNPAQILSRIFVRRKVIHDDICVDPAAIRIDYRTMKKEGQYITVDCSLEGKSLLTFIQCEGPQDQNCYSANKFAVTVKEFARGMDSLTKGLTLGLKVHDFTIFGSWVDSLPVTRSFIADHRQQLLQILEKPGSAHEVVVSQSQDSQSGQRMFDQILYYTQYWGCSSFGPIEMCGGNRE